MENMLKEYFHNRRGLMERVKEALMNPDVQGETLRKDYQHGEIIDFGTMSPTDPRSVSPPQERVSVKVGGIATKSTLKKFLGEVGTDAVKAVKDV
jgi:hypothetical protein